MKRVLTLATADDHCPGAERLQRLKRNLASGRGGRR